MNQTRQLPKEPWYSNGLSFECTQCGNCCSGAPGHVWVDDEEIMALAVEMGYSNDLATFEQKFVRKVGRRKSLVEYPDGDCIFLDEKTRRCLVYHSRPIQCRTWPFWKSNLESHDDWQAAAEGCPGCDRGRLYSLEEILIQRDKKAI